MFNWLRISGQSFFFFDFWVVFSTLQMFVLSAQGVVDIVIEDGLLLYIHALHEIPGLHLHAIEDLGPTAVIIILLPKNEGIIRGNFLFSSPPSTFQ